MWVSKPTMRLRKETGSIKRTYWHTLRSFILYAGIHTHYSWNMKIKKERNAQAGKETMPFTLEMNLPFPSFAFCEATAANYSSLFCFWQNVVTFSLTLFSSASFYYTFMNCLETEEQLITLNFPPKAHFGSTGLVAISLYCYGLYPSPLGIGLPGSDVQPNL